ncbi:NAD(P)H-dependent oxidoreductase [uncultured Methanoregula sp.]|uniref:flavodoxin family protein n=1 Tax=uncultured Methanoregula sp. TaxID=1005933 RepID=UPI002AAA63BA|nr:NAD(P)H-dependent oxidoreductase [uncultured Methanoregula sp.]
MKTCIIYHSHSGNTRGVAERVKTACGGELIEIKLKEGHSSPVACFLGLFRLLKHETDPIEPATIDLSAFDCVVIGTPVWARKSTPAISAAVVAMKECSGKRAVLFATCGKAAGETLPLLARSLEARGMTVTGQFVFTSQDLRDDNKVNALAECVNQTGRAL